MSLFEEYGLDIPDDEIPDAPSFDVDDGIYTFEIGDSYLKEWNDTTSLIIEYLLGEEGKKFSEWFRLPVDTDNITAKELQKLSFLKQRYESLGVYPAKRIGDVSREDLVGLTGTLKIGHDKTGKYQNIKTLRVGEPSDHDDPIAPAPNVAASVRASRPTRAPDGGRRTAVVNPFK